MFSILQSGFTFFFDRLNDRRCAPASHFSFPFSHSYFGL